VSKNVEWMSRRGFNLESPVTPQVMPLVAVFDQNDKGLAKIDEYTTDNVIRKNRWRTSAGYKSVAWGTVTDIGYSSEQADLPDSRVVVPDTVGPEPPGSVFLAVMWLKRVELCL
jgi:hypothetical protein